MPVTEYNSLLIWQLYLLHEYDKITSFGHSEKTVNLYQIDLIDKVDAYRKIHPVKIISYEKQNTTLIFTRCETLMADIKNLLIQNLHVKKF